MKKLSLYSTDVEDELAWPEQFEKLSLDSSARYIFSDLHTAQPFVIDSELTANDAEHIMSTTHSHLEFVIDKQNHLIGVVSFDELNKQEIMKKTSQGFNRQDLSIKDFLHPKEKMKSFDYKELLSARIKDVIVALKENGQQYCLVIDRDIHKVVGIISATEIARKLQLPLDFNAQNSFLDIYKAVKAA